MSWAAVLLATALLVSGHHSQVRIRAGKFAPARAHPQPDPSDDPLATASSFDVLAACLRSGMAVSTAAAATAASAPKELARVLNRAADLLALGADPATAWSDVPSPQSPTCAGAHARVPMRGAHPVPNLRGGDHTEALLRLARRSAASGAALAQGVAELAVQSRQDAADAAAATAERASVLIAGPLGLCYLPAFLCLGIVPVVAGLASEVLQSGLL